MKKTIFLLAALLLLSLAAGCAPATDESTASTTGTTSTEASDATSKAPDELVITKKDWPTLCGTFMQPGAFASYSQKQMDEHFAYLAEAGLQVFILQWSFTNTSGGVNDVYFEDDFTAQDKGGSYNAGGAKLLEKILSSAEKTGLKVFIGLNDNSEWWTTHVSSRAWIDEQTRLAEQAASAMYNAYKSKYPNAFYGWYFTFEFSNYTTLDAYLDNGAYLLSGYRDMLAAIDENMPMLLSPYISSSSLTPSETELMWTKVFAKTSFRAGDIFCCQDAVGAGHINIDEMDAYFAALKRAVDTKEGLLFWANNEDFCMDGTTAPFQRLLRQLEISSKYCQAHITFAYSHYQSPDVGRAGHHDAYLYYLENGKIPESTSLTSPDFTITLDALGLKVDINAVLDNSSNTLYKAVIECNGTVAATLLLEAAYGKSSYSLSHSELLGDTAGEIKITLTLEDYFGNKTEPVTKTYAHSESKYENIAPDKKYSVENSSPNYPDENGKSLTDGLFGQTTYSSREWIGFIGNGAVTVDLGSVENISFVELNTLFDNGAGVHIPTNISIYISEDGTEYTLAKQQSYAEYTGVSNAAVGRLVILDRAVSCRYIKIEVSGKSWIFIDEISIYSEKQ